MSEARTQGVVRRAGDDLVDGEHDLVREVLKIRRSNHEDLDRGDDRGEYEADKADAVPLVHPPGRARVHYTPAQARQEPHERRDKQAR